MQRLDSHRRAEDVAYEVPDEDPVHTETDKALMWERWRQATSQPRSEFQISNIPDVDALGGSTEGAGREHLTKRQSRTREPVRR